MILQSCVFPAFPASQEPSVTVSPTDRTVSRFMEEEELRKQDLFQRLDIHVKTLQESNDKTVSKYLSSVSGLESAQTFVANGQ